MPGNRRSCPGIKSGAPGDPRDKVKAALLKSQSPEGAKFRLPERNLSPYIIARILSLEIDKNPSDDFSVTC